MQRPRHSVVGQPDAASPDTCDFFGNVEAPPSSPAAADGVDPLLDDLLGPVPPTSKSPLAYDALDML